MTDIRIDPADARKIAQHHTEAGDGIEGTAKSLPPAGVDGGVASGLLGSIIGKVTGDCDDLAVANDAAAAVLNQVAENYLKTEEGVRAQFNKLVTELEAK